VNDHAALLSSCKSTAPLAHGHIRALDGLRGVAILMVLVIHFYPKWLIADAYPTLTPIVGRIVAPGGYGVELFFVLSGFLITGILLDTKDTPGFLVKFYARRTLRIFPLYYAALAVLLFLLPLFVTFDAGAQAIVAHQAWLWTYIANWPTTWVWDDSQIFLLGHFWSLCVEEQFYLVWPAVVSTFSPRNVLRVTLALVGVGMACRGINIAFGESTPVLFRWVTLHRIDGLAIGAMLATVLRDPGLTARLPSGRAYKQLLLVSALTSLGYVMLPRRIHHPIFDVFGATIIVTFFGLILLGTLRLRPGDMFHRPLVSATLVTFGKYSYGLYVIHGILRPAFEKIFDLRGLPTSHGLPLLWMCSYYLLATASSLGLAWLSFHCFEKWFLRLKRHFDYAPAKSG
jgi:peptidoglycan/LPS O-acetylase OafA/YrhL